MLHSGLKRTAIYTSADAQQLQSNGREWNFHDANTQEHLHTLHPYPAKFIPQIPRKAITKWSKPGDLIYDPFCGCGTTLLEASLLGRNAIGTDNNAVAVLVTKAKISNYNQDNLARLQRFAERLDRKLSEASPKNAAAITQKIDYWFSAEVINRLAALKSIIVKETEPNRTLLLAVFSAILVRVSFQDSDTRYSRIVRSIHAANVDSAFTSKLNEALDSLPRVMLPNRGTSNVTLTDARSVPFIQSGSVDFIVTSPPYLNAYDYHKYHRQRLHWIDGDVAFARDQEIGSHDEFTKPRATPAQYFLDIGECFAEWRRVLKRHGRCLILIGDAIVSKSPVAVADRYIALAADCGLRLEDRWIRELKATKRSFNIRNSRISHEHVLLFQKP